MNIRRVSTYFAVSVFFLSMVCAPMLAADHPGKALWDQGKCHVCHGDDGHGQTPAGKMLKAQDLASAAVQKLTDAELFKIIKDGKGKMPAQGKSFNDQQIKTLVSYVRTFAKKK